MRSVEVRVGALLLVSLGLLLGFVVLLGNLSFGGGYRLRVDYDFSGNLQPGAAVKISGIKVGKVEEVRFFGGQVDPEVGRRVQVRVTLWLESRAKEAIRKDAEFFVNTQGVLGEQYLEIKPGSYDQPPLGEGAIVRGVDPPRTDLIVARLYEVLDSFSSLLRDDKDVIRDFLKSGASVVRTLDGLLRANQPQIGRLLGSVNQLTREAASLLGQIRAGVGDGRRLDATLGNIEALTALVRREAAPLLARAMKALDGVDALTAVVGPGERDKLKRALDELVALAAKVDRVASDAQSLVADVRRGKGTAGALLVDPQVYDDLKELVRDLKRNPWKLFWKE
jgi:phospholipid/cholesterol/gamma-HCH transport system substrate-binding protein